MSYRSVSAVIATYNMGQHVGKAVQSILNQQNYPIAELHVVDDGSTDNTVEVMQQFDDARLHFHQLQHVGVCSARNYAIARAQGDYIAFCDADDLWTPNKLSVQMPVFDDPKVAVSYANLAPMDEQGNLRSPRERDFYSGDILLQMFIRNCVPFGTAIVKKSVLDEVGGFNPTTTRSMDWDLWLRIGLKHHFQYVDEVTYHYLHWPGQMSNNYRGRFEWQSIIRNRFLDQHADRIPKAYVKEGWATEYVELGRNIALNEKKYVEPMRCYTKAMQYVPGYKPAVKAMVKMAIFYDHWHG